MKLTTVMVVDDHALIREGITKILSLESSLKMVAEASCGQQALRLCHSHQPDIVLLDINLPDINGIELCKIIKKNHPSTEIIALTIHDQEEYIMEMIRNGVSAYLLKDVSPDQLIYTILQVADGKSFISPSLTAMVFNKINRFNSETFKGRPRGLTERELDVLRLVANGNANKEIAKKLFISDKTVKNHLTNIFQKLEVADRTQAALLAIKEKIVEI